MDRDGRLTYYILVASFIIYTGLNIALVFGDMRNLSMMLSLVYVCFLLPFLVYIFFDDIVVLYHLWKGDWKRRSDSMTVRKLTRRELFMMRMRGLRRFICIFLPHKFSCNVTSLDIRNIVGTQEFYTICCRCGVEREKRVIR